MLDQEAIAQQLALLATHRRTLAHLMEQAAQFGGEVFAPPQTANGIAEARQQIRRIKANLRKNGVQVEDDPNDTAPRQRKPAQAQQAGDVVSGDKVAGDKVMGDKLMGNKRTINTQGGDYAEGNIDKRQGTFIDKQIAQPSLAPALHQLRAPVGDFVGRTDEINRLVSALSAGGTGAAISGVRGMGGIGKTELAYAAAQRLAEQFPDAQLLIGLRGASANSLTPEAALRTVIRAFEREAKLPDDLSQLKAIYSSVLTGKRALILADDAKDGAQVRPLLPPQGCALLITSRNRFGLPGMAAIDLGTPPPEDAEKLLLEICPRTGEHAPRLAKLCGYLPLALRVSAGVLDVNDTRDVAHYLKQLEAERLKHLRDSDNPDDPQASVEASMRLSYDALEPTARSALCQISVFPASFDLEATKAVVVVAGDISEVLELLRRRSLLEWDARLQRFSLHDLVRVFVAARLKVADVLRLRHAKYYVTTHQARMEANRLRLVLRAEVEVEAQRIKVIFNALHESGVEIPPAVGKAILATATEDTWHASEAEVTDDYLRLLTSAPSKDFILQPTALSTAELINLALAYRTLGRVYKTIASYEQALEFLPELGDLRVGTTTGWNLSTPLEQQGNLAQVVELLQVDVDFLCEIGHPDAEERAAHLEILRRRLAASQNLPPAEKPDEG